MRPSAVWMSSVRDALTATMISIPRTMSSTAIEGAPPRRAACSGTYGMCRKPPEEETAACWGGEKEGEGKAY